MVAKAKWKVIRSNFRRELRKATTLFTRPFNKDTYVSRSPDFKLLSFLIDDILEKEQGKTKNRLTKKTIKAIKSSRNPRKIKSEENLVETEEVTEVRENGENIEVMLLENNSNHCNVPIMPSISTPTPEVEQPLHQLISVKPEFAEANVNHDYAPLQSLQYSNSISINRPFIGFNITPVHRADDDYLFLMSCLTKLNSLSPGRNMYIRYKIQELFFREFNPELPFP